MGRFEGITVSKIEQGIYNVSFSRPPHNYIGVDLISGIGDAYEEVGALTEARVIVLTAAGKNFCAGADFSGQISEAEAAGKPSAHSPDFGITAYGQAARIMAAPLPVVAAINGAAVGGGFGLACTPDFRVGNALTRMSTAFAQIGTHHGFGLSATLPYIVGPQRANELMLTGRRLHGEEAYRLGLLDRFVEGPDLEGAAVEFAREIASSAPLSIRAIRATLRRELVERFRAAIEHESREQARLFGTRDFIEGARAMIERRPPRFVGV